MKRVIAALSITFALLVGFAVAPNGGTAQASHGSGSHTNIIENSLYSKTPTTVCGWLYATSTTCITVAAGGKTTSNSGWDPTQVAVGPYYQAAFRVIKDGYTSPWASAWGGRYGTWISIENLENFWGPGIQVRVVLDGPFY